MMDAPIEALVRSIAEIAPGLHTAGTLSGRVLEAIARHAGRRRILRSAETGCGASTLLLSHLSPEHTVFAFDGGSGSIANVLRSPLFRRESVTIIDGPTQRTLPAHRFAGDLQLALIDGPHAYPFPDLEYYFLYPHLSAGALLVVDDIQIRTVHHLFEFLSADAMFRPVEVEGSTAFFERTDAPAFDPYGDNWSGQNYNRAPLLRYVWRDKLRALGLRRRRTPFRADANVRIVTPDSRATVGAAGAVGGSAVVPSGGHLWVLVHRAGIDGWWPQGGGPVELSGNRWAVQVQYGEPQDCGFNFEIAALIVGEPTHQLWADWVARAEPACPPVALPSANYVWAESFRTVRKHR